MRIIILALLGIIVFNGEAAGIRHDMTIELLPEKGKIKVTDEITNIEREVGDELLFELNGALDVEIKEPRSARLETTDNGSGESGRAPVKKRRIRVKGSGDAGDRIALEYQGLIKDAPKMEGGEYARGFAESWGYIGPEGVSLSPQSFWYPVFGDEMTTFRLKVRCPEGWRAVSQGKMGQAASEEENIVVWEQNKPNDGIYLTAGRYVYYEKQSEYPEVVAQVFLREKDDELAKKYLDATHRYIQMYSELIGTYPYSKFALVENFWETGYGMPSFTLLGPRVLRFPFILRSSYPHEILHNWWGNGVFTDYEKGNWCEGITAYLADHLMKENEGSAWDYRKDTLKKYMDFVGEERDFPLRDFRSRHDPATESIGYGKALMVFHMLRIMMGDELFVNALKIFYEEHLGKRAAWEDVQVVFEKTSGKDLEWFFSQWIDRTGASELEMSQPVITPSKDGFSFKFTVQQKQKRLFRLKAPLMLSIPGEEIPREYFLDLEDREETIEIELPAEPSCFALDPRYDVFRMLGEDELFPSLSGIFGAERTSFVFPAAEDSHLIDGYKMMAGAWSAGKKERAEIVEEFDASDANQFKGRSVWVLGRSNSVLRRIEDNFRKKKIRLSNEGVCIEDKLYEWADHSFVAAFESPFDNEETIVWVALGNPEAAAGLARKIPHYSKYGMLIFEGVAPDNIYKAKWDTSVNFQFKFDREALAGPDNVYDSRSLMKHVRFLASEELEGRGVGSEGLKKATEYAAEKFKSMGLKPAGEYGAYFQNFNVPGPQGKSLSCRNIIGVLEGSCAELKEQSVVLAAHIDHLGRGWPDVRAGNEGKIHPGADDNASGVAVVLETARYFSKKERNERSIIFAIFSAEECGALGSQFYVENPPEEYPVHGICSVINLDSVGRLEEGRLLLLGTGSSDRWEQLAQNSASAVDLEIQTVTEDPGGSDQISFIKKERPAVQFFTGPHQDYNRPSDTWNKIDDDGLVKIADFTVNMIEVLANLEYPLTFSPDAADIPARHKGGPHRQSSLGIVPDFAFAGPGVKIKGAVEGSPADKAGLIENDVILEIDSRPVENLKSLSDALKQKNPGDTINIKLLREQNYVNIAVVLVGR